MRGRPHDLLAEAAPVLAQGLLPLGGAAACAAVPPLPVLLPVVVGAVVRQLRLRLAQQPAVATPVNNCTAFAHLLSSVLQNKAADISSNYPNRYT